MEMHDRIFGFSTDLKKLVRKDEGRLKKGKITQAEFEAMCRIHYTILWDEYYNDSQILNRRLRAKMNLKPGKRLRAMKDMKPRLQVRANQSLKPKTGLLSDHSTEIQNPNASDLSIETQVGYASEVTDETQNRNASGK